MSKTLEWIKFESMMNAISKTNTIGLSKFNDWSSYHLSDEVRSDIKK